MEEFERNFIFLMDNFHVVPHDENYQRAKDFCREFSTKNFVSKLAPRAEFFWDKNDLIENVPLNLIEPHCQVFFERSIFHEEDEFLKFLVINFRGKLTIPEHFRYQQSVSMLKIIGKYFPEVINQDFITSITYYAISYNFIEVFIFIITNFKDLINERILAREFESPCGDLTGNYSAIQIFTKLFNHFPDFFNYLKNHKIDCDFLSFEFLTGCNFGMKVNLTQFYLEEEFLRQNKKNLRLNDFVINTWKKFHKFIFRGEEYEIVRITIINDKWYPDIEQLKDIIRSSFKIRRSFVGLRPSRTVSEEQKLLVEPFINRYPEDREFIFKKLFID